MTDLWRNTLLENNIATEEEISLVCSINGQNEESFLDIVYSRTGLRSWEQLKSDGYYVPTQLLDDDLEDEEITQKQRDNFGNPCTPNTFKNFNKKFKGALNV